MAYQWMYGVPLSGLSFPLITASGTYAKNYAPAQLSGVISKNGGAWAALGTRFSGIPGDGVYTLASLSSTEMTCYSWLIKITANSGCMDQSILGYNLSGLATAVQVSALSNVQGLDYSGIAAQVWNSLQATYTSNTTMAVIGSGNAALLTAVSGIPLAVGSGWIGCSGNDKILTAVSSVGVTAATVDTSAIAARVWNTTLASYTSSTTFGGNFSGLAHAVDCSGNNNLLVAISGIPLAVGSGWVGCSGNDNILTAVSSVPTALVATLSLAIAAISGLKNDVSGLPGILVAVSAPKILASAYHSGATIMGVANAMSGNAGTANVDVSTIAAQVWNSVHTVFTSSTTFGGATTVSGLNVLYSSFAPIMVAVSAIPNVVASGFAPILTAVSSVPGGIVVLNNVDMSSIAAQVWNSVNTVFTSATTFGGVLVNNTSGLPGILVAISGIPLAVASGINRIAVGLSSIPDGVIGASIEDADVLVSGTVGHTLRLVRWFSWDNMYIDKTFTPARLYLKTDGTNYSSWWSVTDTSSVTSRVRGG
jgi:hypothetical protein